MPKKPHKRRTLKRKLSLSIDPEMLVKAKQVAKKQHRSISSLVAYLIDAEWTRSRSKSPDEDPPDPRTNRKIYRLSEVTDPNFR